MSTFGKWLEDGDHYVTGFGASWVLGENDWGDLYVPSLRERLRRGEPWWAKSFRPRNPLHWPFALWTLIRRGFAFIESQ